MRTTQAVARDAGVVHEHRDGTERGSRPRRTRRRPRRRRRRRRAPRAPCRPPARPPLASRARAVCVGRVTEARPDDRRARARRTIARPMPRDAAGDERDAVGGRLAHRRAPSQERAGPRHARRRSRSTSTRSPSLHAAVVDRFEQRERDRRRRRVAVALDVHERALGLEAEPLRGRVDDADVGLVGHEPRDVVGASTPARSSVQRRRVDDGAHRAPEHLLARHLHVVLALGDRARASRAAGCRRPGSRAGRRPSRRSRGPTPSRPGVSASARAPRRPRRRRTGSTVRAVVGIDDAAQRLGADDQHVLVAGVQHRRADDELVDEARRTRR